MSSKVKLVVSIDVEEDNWKPREEGLGVENVEELPKLAAFFARLGVRATYFTAYQVAIRPRAAAVVREIVSDGTAEVGAHLHPWNTPPFHGPRPRHATMLVHYPADQQLSKIRHLTETIESTIGVLPTSFRAGRFGLGSDTLPALITCGYETDSSVTPYIDWSDADHGPDFMGAPVDVYRLGGKRDVCIPVPDGPLVEVPVSAGFTRFAPQSWPGVERWLTGPSARRLGVAGLCARTGLVRRVILSPETTSVRDMLALSRALLEGGVAHLHLFFHSSSLSPGLTPFARTRADVERIYRRIEEYLDRLSGLAEIGFSTVGEAAWDHRRVGRADLSPEPPARPTITVDEPPSGGHEHRLRADAVRRPDAAPDPKMPTHRLLVISYHFPPDGSVGGLRWAGFSKSLAREGWEVHVLTAANGSTAMEAPGLRIHALARRRTLNDLYNTLAHRVRGAPAESGAMQGTRSGGGEVPAPSIASKALRWIREEIAMALVLPDHARGWILRAAHRARALARRHRFDVVVTSGPPHSAHIVGLLATIGTRRPLVLDMRDPWYDLATKEWGRPLYSTMLARATTPILERLAFRAARLVISNTREFAAQLRSEGSGRRIAWIPNGIDPERLPASRSDRYPPLGLAYVGSLYAGRDLGPILDAFRVFLDRHGGIAKATSRLRIAGFMAPAHEVRFQAQLDELGIAGHVELLGVVPPAAALDLLARSTLSIVLAQDQELQIPAKLYESMGLGIPTLVLAEEESAAAREAIRIGAFTRRPEDLAGIADLFERLATGEIADHVTPRQPIDYPTLARSMARILSDPDAADSRAEEWASQPQGDGNSG